MEMALCFCLLLSFMSTFAYFMNVENRESHGRAALPTQVGEEEIIKIFVLSNSHETKLPYFLFSSLLRRLVFFHFSLRDEYNEEINQSTHPHVN